MLTSQHDLPDELVAADGVKVHDDDLQGAVAYLLPRNLELKGLKKRDHPIFKKS